MLEDRFSIEFLEELQMSSWIMINNTIKRMEAQPKRKEITEQEIMDVETALHNDPIYIAAQPESTIKTNSKWERWDR